jgi:DNA invertase Pin-like site-specific DNA recombinase
LAKKVGSYGKLGEKATPPSRIDRPAIAETSWPRRDFLRPGDELVVVKLDRLGRNTRDVLNLVHELDPKGAGRRVLKPEFSTPNFRRRPTRDASS